MLCWSRLFSTNSFLGCLARAAQQRKPVTAGKGKQSLFPEAKSRAPAPSAHPEHALHNTTKPKNTGFSSPGSMVFHASIGTKGYQPIKPKNNGFSSPGSIVFHASIDTKGYQLILALYVLRSSQMLHVNERVSFRSDMTWPISVVDSPCVAGRHNERKTSWGGGRDRRFQCCDRPHHRVEENRRSFVRAVCVVGRDALRMHHQKLKATNH